MNWTDRIEAYPIAGKDVVGPDPLRVNLSAPIGVEVRALLNAAEDLVNSTEMLSSATCLPLYRALNALRAKVTP